MAKTAFEMMTADEREDEAEEGKEPPVEAVPRLTREAFGYLEPRPGIDGRQYFGSCGSCQSFVSEAAMTGAVLGSRCVLFGSQMRITDDDSCNHFAPFGAGAPCEETVSFNAAALRRGLPQAIYPWLAGYKPQCPTQCRTCRFGDTSGTAPGKLECEAFESLNETSGNLFALEKTVDAYAGCALWQERPADLVPGLAVEP